MITRRGLLLSMPWVAAIQRIVSGSSVWRIVRAFRTPTANLIEFVKYATRSSTLPKSLMKTSPLLATLPFETPTPAPQSHRSEWVFLDCNGKIVAREPASGPVTTMPDYPPEARTAQIVTTVTGDEVLIEIPSPGIQSSALKAQKGKAA